MPHNAGKKKGRPADELGRMQLSFRDNTMERRNWDWYQSVRPGAAQQLLHELLKEHLDRIGYKAADSRGKASPAKNDDDDLSIRF